MKFPTISKFYFQLNKFQINYYDFSLSFQYLLDLHITASQTKNSRLLWKDNISIYSSLKNTLLTHDSIAMVQNSNYPSVTHKTSATTCHHQMLMNNKIKRIIKTSFCFVPQECLLLWLSSCAFGCA